MNPKLNPKQMNTRSWHEECKELCQELGFDSEQCYSAPASPHQTWEEEFQQLAIELDQLINTY